MILYPTHKAYILTHTIGTSFTNTEYFTLIETTDINSRKAMIRFSTVSQIRFMPGIFKTIYRKTTNDDMLQVIKKPL